MENVELMEGLEILSVGRSMPIVVSFILEFLCLVVIMLSLYLVVDAIWEGSLDVVIIGLLFMGIGVLLGGIIIDKTMNPSHTYKVSVDDSVSLNEFYSKYEILNVEGKVYTIRPRGE